MGYKEFYIFTFISFFLLTHGQSANILGVFEFNGKSHFLMFERLMKSLAERGHEVHVLNHFPQKKPFPNYFDIDVSGSVPNVLNNLTIETVRKRDTIGTLNFIWTVTRGWCEAVKKHPNAQKLLNSNQKYDLLIMESFGSECFIGLADTLKTPLVTIVTSAAMPWTSQRIGNPDNPAYVPNFFIPYGNKMSFIERFWNTLYYIVINISNHYYNEIPTNELSKRYFGNDVAPIWNIAEKNTSMILVNSHFSINGARPAVPGFIEVGGLHIHEPNSLPKDLQKFLDASEHGVVYFSLGSLIQVQTFSPEKLKALMDAFGALPERVLMKYTGDTLPGKPSNVMTGKWLPQQDILRFAVRLLYDDITKESLLSAIRTLLDDSRYAANAKKTSFQFRDRPQTALETAVYWVEYVIRHRGAPHLRSAGADLPTYQYLLLDVISVLVLGVVSFLYLTYIVIRTVLRLLLGRKKRNKSKRQ
uniref:UDP-glucuronosyltransferase n=1 Tax=Timema cristinae TaxID=61476 RepID=A0A7R9GRW6_TIMCR|nr:unnamed protein product [Timema cristinae]